MIRSRPILCAITLVVAACRKDPGQQPPAPVPSASASHTDEPEHEGLPKRVRLSSTVAKAAGIKTQPLVRDTLAAAVELPGEVAPDPDKSAHVAPRMAGRVERVSMKEGQTVKAGEVLAVVRAPQLSEFASSYQSLSTRAVAARSNATRLRKLLESRMTSEQEVVSAEAEASALEVEARAAAERLRAVGSGTGAASSWMAITAPIAGVVASRSAIVGQPVTPDQTIATIVDLAEVWFLARVFEQNLARVRVGARSDVRLNAYPDEAFEGIVEYVAQQIDPSARTVVARIRLKNRGSMLRLGLFGTARIETGEASSAPAALLVPHSALTEIGGKSVVFVKHADDDYELHEVVLGRAGLGKVEVLAGLREKEDVVVDGVFTLKSAVLRSSLAEEEE